MIVNKYLPSVWDGQNELRGKAMKKQRKVDIVK